MPSGIFKPSFFQEFKVRNQDSERVCVGGNSKSPKPGVCDQPAFCQEHHLELASAGSSPCAEMGGKQLTPESTS